MDRSSLPRTRGDRPRVAGFTAYSDESPPHPRGSTLRERGGHWQRYVSPAPAGIDPSQPVGPARRSRLPRTRGDRPFQEGKPEGVYESPPHPRGSTLAFLVHPVLQPVSPAPAGIDRCRDRSQYRRRGLPRTRGDRPLAYTALSAGSASPPHPRGSTHLVLPIEVARDVSPAPAGIDPAMMSSSRIAPSLPRTRGDRPQCRAMGGASTKSPPHPRGSTPVPNL